MNVANVAIVHIKSPRESSKNHIILKAESLAPLVGHRDDSVVLSAMTLLVASTAITAPMSPGTFTLLKKSFLHLHSHQNAEFRNQFVVIIRDFTQRLAASSVYLGKEVEKLRKAVEATNAFEQKEKKKELTELCVETKDRLQSTKQFVEWYVKFLFSLLESGRGHAQVTTALRILKMLMHTGLDKEFFDPDIKVDPKTHKSVNVLKGNPIVWPFSVKISTEANLRWILENLFNRYEDARLLAAEILSNASKAPWKTQDEAAQYTVDAFNRMIKSGRARDADGFAQLALVLSFLAARNDEVLPTNILGVPIFNTGNAVAIVDWLSTVLESQFLAQAKVKLTEAVAKKPMHGVISAIRQVFIRIGLKSVLTRSAELSSQMAHQLRTKLLLNGALSVKLCLDLAVPSGRLFRLFSAILLRRVSLPTRRRATFPLWILSRS